MGGRGSDLRVLAGGWQRKDRMVRVVAGVNRIVGSSRMFRIPVQHVKGLGRRLHQSPSVEEVVAVHDQREGVLQGYFVVLAELLGHPRGGLEPPALPLRSVASAEQRTRRIDV